MNPNGIPSSGPPYGGLSAKPTALGSRNRMQVSHYPNGVASISISGPNVRLIGGGGPRIVTKKAKVFKIRSIICIKEENRAHSLMISGQHETKHGGGAHPDISFENQGPRRCCAPGVPTPESIGVKDDRDSACAVPGAFAVTCSWRPERALVLSESKEEEAARLGRRTKGPTYQPSCFLRTPIV